MVKLILSCDLTNIEDIRDVFFNIWITNYEGVRIVRDVIEHIINETEMTEECKLNIVIKTAELEYNMLRGRRDIIHFDSVVTMIMEMIQNHSSNILKTKISVSEKNLSKENLSKENLSEENLSEDAMSKKQSKQKNIKIKVNSKSKSKISTKIKNKTKNNEDNEDNDDDIVENDEDNEDNENKKNTNNKNRIKRLTR
jgi:hypothetical protein